jgi:hypothetical protein
MRLSPSYLVAVVVAVICVAPAAALDPRVYEVDFVTGSQRSGLTKNDVREIRRFIRTIRGIDHNVQQIDGLQPAEVMVLTGRDYREGDVLYPEGRRAMDPPPKAPLALRREGRPNIWDRRVLRPNQAMQLTASKCAIYASSGCHRVPMLRGMHRGLAAADLVSR